ncbi:hypothetical protein [Gibbsiella quercinecans]|uniref:hypothetical protein n=1 Tax=Gibbsiella quercinecans TaxID=929813 RepID=UPI00242D07AD|nr:hypothetical protein [Gibbsiella quercinecans]
MMELLDLISDILMYWPVGKKKRDHKNKGLLDIKYKPIVPIMKDKSNGDNANTL